MRFLGVFRLGEIFAWYLRQIVLAELRPDLRAHFSNRFGSHVHAIGPHISDQAGGFAANIDTLVEPLCNLHGA